MKELKAKCRHCERMSNLSPENQFRPFCSERCQLIDFGGWANEEFSLPGETAAPPADVDPSFS